MKAVVFGGSGFLGSHVADALSDNGYEVTIFDIKSSAYLKKSQKMIVGDVLEQNKVEEVISGCSIVYNFAGIADIDEARKNPLGSVKYNILGNSVILEACRKFDIKRFIFASSLYVYSKAGSFYRATKQACELLIENYYEVFGLPYTILRYGSLYGPRSNDKNFIFRIIKQALNNGRITCFGTGDELREYIHVFDAARGSVEALSDEFKNQYVIITGNYQTKIKDVVSAVKKMLDDNIEVEFLSSKENFHYDRTPYSFVPPIGRKLVSKTYLDLNQGILEAVRQQQRALNSPSKLSRKIQKKK